MIRTNIFEDLQFNPVRVITLNEPFASLMIHGKQETRSRKTHIRGLVAIHTALKPYSKDKILEITGPEQHRRIKEIELIDDSFGMITSIGYLTGCKYMGDYTGNDASMQTIEQKCFVKFNPALWIWEFEDVTHIQPIKWKGNQGWSIMDSETKKLIKPYAI